MMSSKISGPTPTSAHGPKLFEEYVVYTINNMFNVPGIGDIATHDVVSVR
jgi:hypothetical protein